MKILLTNDDGIDSPALIPTIEALESFGEVITVVPKNQQSWTSKSNIRRSGEIEFKEIKINGRTIYTLDALPADCSNFGIYMETPKPDLLISGANVGHNVGLHAILSSGTVGAAMEGLISGIPSIAISIPYDNESKLISDEFKPPLRILPKLVDTFYNHRPEIMRMISVNLFINIEFDKFVSCIVDDFCFGSLFQKDEHNIVKPRSYYEIDQPKGTKFGTDTWAKVNKLASIIAFDKNAQLIDKNLVSEWLAQNNMLYEI